MLPWHLSVQATRHVHIGFRIKADDVFNVAGCWQCEGHNIDGRLAELADVEWKGLEGYLIWVAKAVRSVFAPVAQHPADIDIESPILIETGDKSRTSFAVSSPKLSLLLNFNAISNADRVPC